MYEIIHYLDESESDLYLSRLLRAGWQLGDIAHQWRRQKVAEQGY